METRRRLWFSLFVLLFLCGCEGRASYHIQPSAVPQKWVTKTAISPTKDSNETLPVIASDPWSYCESVLVSNSIPERVSEIQSEEFRRRVQITFMIQDAETENEFIAERCMNGKLYVCRINGLNNCAEKLDFTSEPNEAMRSFCSDPEREGAILNRVITGINSAFEWRCHEETAVITRQIAEPDTNGYDKAIWFEIPKPE